ncbi:unnamed protein product [Rotaria magnacalcarata]|uniref:Protein kinase domain-containing protein n=1 Tax=Rotaria magnacalcarata TaxID=392030 RepID=A0A815D9T3_9BILA|nr:unnamed protein product [Rotaria magnacalcarata]
MPNITDGHFGKIYEAEWISRKEKPIVVIQMDTEPSEYEAMVYTNFTKHRNIVDTLGFVGNARDLVLLLQERAPHGNLKALLQNGRFQPSQNVLITIFIQIVEAMIYVISEGIVHGNLCCANILVFRMNSSTPTENWVKLTNFGWAHKNDRDFSDDRRLIIPVRYCAPEILRSAGRTNYSEYSDAYSMGVLMWEAFSKGKVPYESSITNSEVRQRKMLGEKLSKPFMCDDQMWDIIIDCWHNEPAIRLEFALIRALLSRIDPNLLANYKYELNVHVKLKRPLNGNSDKFFEADWIPQRDPPIVLMVMNEETAEQEVSLYKKFESHRNIVKTFDFVKNDRQSIMFLQERAPHGNLQKLLQSGNFQPSQNVLASIFLQITEAMIYLVGENFVHGDLRCSNVLVFEMDPSDPKKNRVKLTNFSRACPIGHPVAGRKIPASLIPYCAPEIRRSRNKSIYSEFSEVYSMGVLMWQACSQGAIPFAGDTISGDTYKKTSNDRRLERPTQCQENLWAVISNSLLIEPEIRFSFDDLKTQIALIDFSVTRCVHCDNCNQEIPETDIETHLVSCVPPPVPRPAHISFTRCRHCSERCLGSQLEDHQKTCRENPANFRPILSTRCNKCNKEFPNSDIENHQKSCLPATARIHRSQQPVGCENCRQQYAATEIGNHKKTCPSKPITPVHQSPQSGNHRNGNHNRPQPDVTVNTTTERLPREPRDIQFVNCNRQIPQNEITAHRNICRPKPISCMDRFCSWISHCCATN